MKAKNAFAICSALTVIGGALAVGHYYQEQAETRAENHRTTRDFIIRFLSMQAAMTQQEPIDRLPRFVFKEAESDKPDRLSYMAVIPSPNVTTALPVICTQQNGQIMHAAEYDRNEGKLTPYPIEKNPKQEFYRQPCYATIMKAAKGYYIPKP